MKPNVGATVLILCGAAITSFMLPDDDPVEIYRVAAIGMGLTLGISIFLETNAGLRHLFRTDLVMLVVFYGLTLLEFLFPQVVDSTLSGAAARYGVEIVLLAFGGLALGRHLVSNAMASNGGLANIEVSPRDLFFLFIMVTLIGYFHILWSVNFNVIEALMEASRPRFSQAWGRGQFGDAYALLYEIGALIYLIPPLAGMMIAKRKDYGLPQKITIVTVLLITFYFGFAGGTRNVLGIYVLTFMVAYFLSKERVSFRQIVMIAVPIFVVTFFALYVMLEFRRIGLANYSVAATKYESVAVDYNIVIISKLSNIFPATYEYLGLEVVYIALVRPIPRVLWPEKPEGLSVSVERALGVFRGITITSTFAGEAYISGGLFGVILASLFFGAAAGLWNRVGQNDESQFQKLLYASGFFCAAITMRSFAATLPAVLPTLALWIYGKFWLSGDHRRRRRLGSMSVKS
jgi:hypothetical protein